MNKIVTRKARFELEADGFSIHTFEILNTPLQDGQLNRPRQTP